MAREFRNEGLNPVLDIENKIWQSVEILSREPIRSHEYSLILLLLVMQREEYLLGLKTSWGREMNYRFQEKVFLFVKENHEFLRGIEDAFKPTIYKIRAEALYEVINLLSSLNQSVLKENFEDIFDNILYKLTKFQGRSGGENILPIEIIRLVYRISELPKSAIVYNPFAGLASFGVFLEKDQEYIGQEINQETWAIGLLRLFAHNKTKNASLFLQDSINTWNPTSNDPSSGFEERFSHLPEKWQFDLIVSNPPFGLRLPKQNFSRYGYIRTCEQFLIERGIEDLKPNGKLIAIIPEAFLFKSGPEQSLRKNLIENDLLEMVVSLPGGLLFNTGVSISILVINKQKLARGFVRFVSGEKFVDSSKPREKRLNDSELVSLIRSQKDSDAQKLVSIKEIQEFDFNLNVNRYLVEESPVNNGTPIGNIVKILGGAKVVEEVIGKLVRIKDLKTGKEDFLLNTDALEVIEIPKNANKLERSALLLTIRWRTLKPTFFEYKGEPIYVSPDVVALEIDEEKVDLAYLVQELYADYVTNQLNRYRTGSTIPYISKEDLLKVLIELPSIRGQRAKITGGALLAIEANRAEIKKQAYEEIASIKHSMGTPLLRLNSIVDNIKIGLDKLDENWEKVQLSAKSSYTLGDAINSVHANLLLLSNLLNNNKRDLEVRSYQLSSIDAIKFFQQYAKDLQSIDGDKFEISLDVSLDLESEFEGGVLINANEELLKIALDAIVENAKRHGFVQVGGNYKIEFQLSLYLTKFSSFLELRVANNGKPFPKGFTLEKLVRKGAIGGLTGNSGIGGHIIDEIVTWHSGRLELMTEPELTLPFTTIYEIFIPIIGGKGYSIYE